MAVPFRFSQRFPFHHPFPVRCRAVLARLRPQSLKARFSLAAAVLVISVAFLLTAATVLIAQRGIEDVVRDREAALISQIARDVDQHVLTRQSALMQLAQELSADVPDPARFQGRLEQYRALDGLFSNLVMLDASGTQLANLQAPWARGRADHATRPHFIATAATRRAQVSEPVAGMVDGRPLVVLTAPILGADGQVVYQLFGQIDLRRDDFLKNLSSARNGAGGGFYLLSRSGVFMSHPDSQRLLQGIDETRGDNPALRAALDGEGATVRATASNGIEALVSHRRLETTGWTVAAVYPTAEAFAFAGQVRLNAAVLALVLLVVVAPLVWLVIDRQLLPLAQLSARMHSGQWTPQLNYRNDEVGELTRAFDVLMAGRKQAEQAMADSERNLRMVANNVPALVAYVDSARRFVFGNERYEAVFGVDAAALRGKPVVEVIGADLYAATEPYINAALRGEEVSFERPVMRAGQLQWDRVQYRPDLDDDGTVRGYFALVDDISEMKTCQLVLAASEKRIRTITDNLPALIAYIDGEQRYRFCNSMYAEIAGVPAERMLGRSAAEVFGTAVHESLDAHMQAALRGEHASFELVQSHQGRSWHLQYDYIPDVGADGAVHGFYSMVQDVTERKATERALLNQQGLLKSVTDNLPALVSSIDRNGIMRFANRQHEDWVGVPVASIVGAPLAALLTKKEYAKHLQYYLPALRGERGRWSFERTIRGVLRHFQADYIPQVEGDETVGVTMLVNDITHIKQVEQKLSALARYDNLTGLPNRTHLMERIERAIAYGARNGTQIALMYLDLDNFKAINDSFGHAGGDAVLIEFGRRLSGCVRQTDTVGRLAGDEFVILLEGLQADGEAQVVANKILRAMERPFDIEGVARSVTTSIGVTTATSGAAGVATLLKHADDALYRAKQRGRNRFATTAMT